MTGRAARVLVVGIDGVRWDALARAATPNLDAIAARGFAAPVRVDEACPTISGPCWTTLLTGTLPATHGIVDNRVRPVSPPPPDMLTRARTAGLRTFAATSWPAFLAADGPGPILADGGERVVCGQAGIGTTIAAWDAADAEVARATAARLGAAGDAAGVRADDTGGTGGSGGAIDLAFAYLGLADEVAHESGCGAAYTEAIEVCDARLGEILEGIDAHAADSPWTVIAATDHGHVDAGGHGGDSDAERTAWIVAGGPGIGRVAPVRLAQTDLAAQVLTMFGLGLPAPDDGFTGVTFGVRDQGSQSTDPASSG